jgi:hypothetical protein
MPISCPDLHKRPVALAEPLRDKTALVEPRQQRIRDFVRAEIAVISSLFHRFLPDAVIIQRMQNWRHWESVPRWGLFSRSGVKALAGKSA